MNRAGVDWVALLLRPMLIAGMVVCLAWPLVFFFEWMLVYWDGTYFLVFSFLACLEGILSERLLQRQRIGGWAYLASRLAEAIVLLVLLKLANYIPLGLDQLLFDARLWMADLETFLTPIDVYTGFAFLFLWAGAIQVARTALALEVEEEGPPPEKNSVAYYLWVTRPSPLRDRQAILDGLGDLFLAGGIVLLLASTLIHTFVSSVRVLALPILLYFALGVALLSQARFSVIYAGWRIQGIPVQSRLARRWLAWVVIFLVGVVLLALILPTGYALGPIRAIWGVIGFVVQILMTGLALLYFLVVWLLAQLLPGVEQPQQPPVPLQPIPSPEALPLEGAASPWLQMIASALFWVLVGGIIVYAFYLFVRDRAGLLDARGEGEGGLWGRFLAWLGRLWQQWWAWQQEAQRQLARRRARGRERLSTLATRIPFRLLRGLAPREMVRYFYLSTERRAARAGQPRKSAQTPHQYRDSLKARFPDLEPDLTGLTDAFVEARYSRRPIEAEDVEVVEPLWQRIKRALRQRRLSP